MNFAQSRGNSRTVLAKASAFVIRSLNMSNAGQFSRGKEIMEQWYYYEGIAVLILFDNRGWVRKSPTRKSWSSTECKACYGL